MRPKTLERRRPVGALMVQLVKALEAKSQAHGEAYRAL
jgi:hypothetical protein